MTRCEAGGRRGGHVSFRQAPAVRRSPETAAAAAEYDVVNDGFFCVSWQRNTFGTIAERAISDARAPPFTSMPRVGDCPVGRLSEC